MARPTRWVTDTDDNHSQWYIERFRTMAAEGVDLGGEARLLDAMLLPGLGSWMPGADPAGWVFTCTSVATVSWVSMPIRS